jgi:hypothetical protein
MHLDVFIDVLVLDVLVEEDERIEYSSSYFIMLTLYINYKLI